LHLLLRDEIMFSVHPCIIIRGAVETALDNAIFFCCLPVHSTYDA